MSRKTVKTIAFVIIIAMVVTSFSFIVFLPDAFGAETTDTVVASTTPEEQQFLTEKTKELENYLKLIHDNYKDEVDYKTLMDGAFEGAMSSLHDPYSVYFTKSEDGQSFVESSTGEYEGIGVGLLSNKDEQCEVTTVTPGAPADKAGIKVGDIIVKVDGLDVTGKTAIEISPLLKGAAGTTVSVTVLREGKEQTFTVIREKIEAQSVFYKMLEGNIGYMLLNGFDADGLMEFHKAYVDLSEQGAKELIVDLRNNPGGLVQTATDIADYFMGSGPIVHYQKQGEIFQTEKARDEHEDKIPIVLLVNEYSASASEILAGAWQDSKTATLVGTTTYGKGVAQIVGATKNGTPFKISTFYFLTPNKHVINEIGITPDYVVRNSTGDLQQAALDAYNSFAPFAEKSKPQPGDTGLNVFAAQQRLLLLGFNVELTGTMDEKTVRAIKEFQKEEGIYVYGTLDFTTMTKLEEETSAFVNNDSKEDLQLRKAVELLTK